MSSKHLIVVMQPVDRQKASKSELANKIIRL